LNQSARGTRAIAVVLGLLACAFLGRVAGQLIVLLRSPTWLPPMQEWYSGLVPYPLLLASQTAILGLQARVSWDLWRGQGYFSRRRPRIGPWLRRFAGLYFAVMLARYVIVMALQPEQRWFGGTIPIFFHWVLAAYLFVWSRHHERAAAS
jgi:hypothetical protein